MKRFLFASALLALAFGPGSAASPDAYGKTVRKGPLEMELLSENLSIAPGEPFYVGWRILRDEGWHTYWKHPGDVGVPPFLEWKLPEGYSAEDLRFPPPERIKMANVSAHGHRGETLFLAKITPPGELKEGDEVRLKAKASWLTCAKQCCPGFLDLGLTLPVEAKARISPRIGKRFASVKASWPEKLEGWSVRAIDHGESIELHLSPSRNLLESFPPRNVYFFGEGNLIRSDRPQIAIVAEGTLRMRLTRAEWAPEDANTLSGLVYAEDGWNGKGSARFARMEARLESPER